MAINNSFTKLNTLAANGSTAAILLNLAVEAEVTMYVGASATWGAGTAILQQSFDGGTTWYTVPNAAWTSGVALQVLGRVSVFGAGQLRVTLSGATSPALDFHVKVEQARSRNIMTFALTANGSTNAFLINDDLPNFPVVTTNTNSAICPWAAQGTWGGGTLVLQVSPDGGATWYNQQAGLTANGIQYTPNMTDLLGRFTLTGATSPSLTMFVVV